MKNENGSALILSLIIMALLAAMIIGFTKNTEIDLFIGRNTRLLKQAFLWSDTGIEITEELISDSEDNRGVTDVNKSFGSYDIIYHNPPLYTPSNSSISIEFNGVETSVITVEYLGSLTSDGTSIIFAAGYEGVGKGLAAGGAMARIYSLRSTGVSDNGESRKRSAEIYRSLSSGK